MSGSTRESMLWTTPAAVGLRHLPGTNAFGTFRRDHKWYSRIAIAELLINALESLHLMWPAPRYDIDQEITRVLRS